MKKEIYNQNAVSETRKNHKTSTLHEFDLIYFLCIQQISEKVKEFKVLSHNPKSSKISDKANSKANIISNTNADIKNRKKP